MGSGGSSLILLALAFGGAAHAGCAPDTVELRGPGGVQRFSVEIADSEAERSRGLSRTYTPRQDVVVYDQPKHAYFWMKNTLLPLDMVFACLGHGDGGA